MAFPVESVTYFLADSAIECIMEIAQRKRKQRKGKGIVYDRKTMYARHIRGDSPSERRERIDEIEAMLSALLQEMEKGNYSSELNWQIGETYGMYMLARSVPTRKERKDPTFIPQEADGVSR